MPTAINIRELKRREARRVREYVRDHVEAMTQSQLAQVTVDLLIAREYFRACPELVIAETLPDYLVEAYRNENDGEEPTEDERRVPFITKADLREWRQHGRALAKIDKKGA